MLVLGISGLSHQATAALLQDGEILAACEEAKLIGRRSPMACLTRASLSA